jgi:TetR/AcrR family transcriptional regulator, transcriptional repressor for nem operon
MASPGTFDEVKILTATVDAFWVRGNEGASTKELVKYKGLNQPSLYNAFGDKRSLYRSALEHYFECSARDRIQRLEGLPVATQWQFANLAMDDLYLIRAELELNM